MQNIYNFIYIKVTYTVYVIPFLKRCNNWLNLIFNTHSTKKKLLNKTTSLLNKSSYFSYKNLFNLLKQKKKWYEWNAFATKFTENCIGITITAQKCKDFRVTFSNQLCLFLDTIILLVEWNKLYKIIKNRSFSQFIPLLVQLKC